MHVTTQPIPNNVYASVCKCWGSFFAPRWLWYLRLSDFMITYTDSQFSTSFLPLLQPRPLEMFFPFDPYLLRRSSTLLDLDATYVVWRRGHPASAVRAELESDSDSESEGEEQELEEDELEGGSDMSDGDKVGDCTVLLQAGGLPFIEL